MVDIRDFILSRGNFGTLRTPQSYINAFNIKKNIDAMFGQGTSDKIANTINRVDDAKDKAKQTFTQGVNQAKSKAKSMLDKALKNPVVQKVAPVVNTVVGATGAANAADRASRYSLTTTPQEKVIDNAQRILYGAGGITGALGLTPVSTGLNAAAMGLNAIPKNYIPRGSGVNNPADYANLYTPEQLAGRGLDPVSVARYLELQEQARQTGVPVQTQPTSRAAQAQPAQQTRATTPTRKTALEQINDFINQTNNASPSLPALPSATGPAYLGQDSVGNLIRQRAGGYQPNIIDIPMPAGVNPTLTTTTGRNLQGLTPIQMAGDTGYDSNGNPYLSALSNQITPTNYSTENTIPNLGFVANPYAQRLADEYNRLTNLDYQKLRQADQLAQVQAQARGALLGLNEPLAYTSDLKGLNDRLTALQNAAQFQDAMALNNRYGMPLSAGFASPDTLVNNIYGPMFKAPIEAQEQYRDAMYKMTTDRVNAINDILVDTNKSELDKARDIEKIDRQFLRDKLLQDERLENARRIEQMGNEAAQRRAELSARTQATLLDRRLQNESEKGTTSPQAKVPSLSALVNALANISALPGMEKEADILRKQIQMYYGNTPLVNIGTQAPSSDGQGAINYFGD